MKSTLKAVSMASVMVVLLAACTNAPPPKTSSNAPVPVMTSQPLESEACCFKPSEIIRYQDKKVAECSKGVEVIRHQNTCHDCAYPVVIRSTSQCCGPDSTKCKE
jgi:hypothetical protein